MASGIDHLVDYLLANIALLGVQGAGSTEFYKIVHNYFEESRKNPTASSLFDATSSSDALTRDFYEKAWTWVTEHSDIRTYCNQAISKLSLSEFEALEAQAQSGSPNDVARPPQRPAGSIGLVRPASRPSKSLLSLGHSLRQRLQEESYHTSKVTSQPSTTTDTTKNDLPQASVIATLDPSASSTDSTAAQNSTSYNGLASETPRPPPKSRPPRKMPKVTLAQDPIFDEPPVTLTGPRLFASQNRVWHAVAGHSMDLKKVPAMEFVLLCIIATHRADGIAQPELIKLSGQDKRSVPHRTDLLAQKGYIEKRPCQDRRVHTSLCIHKRYATAETVLYKPCTVHDVFGNGPFDMTGFIYLLHKLLTDSGGVIPMRELRKRMGVPLQDWNKRAARIAVNRLVKSGMIKQVQTPRKRNPSRFVLCLKLVRKPTEEDLRVQKLRRLDDEPEHPTEDAENSEDDDVLRDMEMELVDESNVDKGITQKEVERIPPQWTPERLLCHSIFRFLELRGPQGADSEDIRARITGKFWKRPLESYVSRLTDNVQKSQPHHLRHLSIVRDNTQTQEKKTLHYVYRTHENYKEAEKLGEVMGMDLGTPTNVFLDKWGFQPLSSNDFHRRTGSSTVSEARPKHNLNSDSKGYAIDRALGGIRSNRAENLIRKARHKHSQKPGAAAVEAQDRTITPALLAKIKRRKSKAKTKRVRTESIVPSTADANAFNDEATDDGAVQDDTATTEAVNVEIFNETLPNVTSSNAQTLCDQGTPSLTMSPEPHRASTLNAYGPLLTMQERKDLGLPLKGRLGKEIEDQIRRDRGIAVKSAKEKRPRDRRNEPALLTMDQREAAGFKRLGRIPQALIEQLRDRRDLGLSTTDALIEEIKRRKITGLSFTDPPLSEWGRDEGTVPPPCGNETENETCLSQAPETMLSPPLSTEAATDPHPYTAATEKPPSKRPFQSDESTSPSASKRVRISAAQEEAPQLAEECTQEDTAAQHASQMPLNSGKGPSRASKRKASDQDDDAGYAQKKARANPRVESSTRSARIRRRVPTTSPFPTLLADNGEPMLPNDGATEQQKDRGSIMNVVNTGSLGSEEVRKAEVKARYDNRAAPGFYYDPFASRKTVTGRGRPKRVFLATFRLPGLCTIDWSTKPSGRAAALPALDPSVTEMEQSQEGGDGRSEPEKVEATLCSDIGKNDEVQTGLSSSHIPALGSPDHIAQHPEHTPTAKDVITLPESTTTDSSDHGDVPSTTVMETVESPPTDLSTPFSVPQQDGEVSTAFLATQVPRSNPVESVNPDLAATQSQSPPRRLAPAGWTAINAPSTYQSPYQSPYQTPYQSPSPEDISASPANPGNNAKKPSIPYVPLFARPLPRTIRKYQPPTPGAWKKLGEGSVQNTRKFVIKQIFDLCGGVFPGNGELPIVLEGIWSELAPKSMLCPDRTTITKTLSQMLGDPKYGRLRRTEMKVRSIEVEKPATKAFYSFESVALNSPEVQRVRAGICASYPLRWYPPEVVQYVSVESRATARKASIELDDSITMEELFPSRAKKINQRIKELARLRNEEAQHRKQQQKKDANDRAYRSTEAEKSRPAEGASTDGARGKRVRLVGLDEKAKPKQNSLLSSSVMDSSFGPQSIKKRFIGLGRDSSSLRDEGFEFSESESGRDDDEAAVESEQISTRTDAPLMVPTSNFHSSSGTFSTEYNAPNSDLGQAPHRGCKRARVVDPAHEILSRKIRKIDQTSRTTDGEYAGEGFESDACAPRNNSRQQSADISNPTLVERLTGLTGNQNEQDYQWPTKKQKTFPTWSERKAKARAKARVTARLQATSPEPPIGNLGPSDMFKKLFCALVVASSMAGDGNSVNWSIVEKVYRDDSNFDIQKAKKTWRWVTKRMATELRDFTTAFQDSFLDAYESGTLDSIADPDTYDWARLVQWAMANCKHPQPSLPVLREALGDFDIDVSTFEMVDRQLWYNKILTLVNRNNRLLKHPYAVPLAPPKESLNATEDPHLKARSWIRANLATPQASYDKNAAHQKLDTLGGDVMEKVVGDLVDANFIRRWKLKRLRPGRNFEFAKAFARNFRRARELGDFMIAVDMKKKLDLAFAQEDKEKRKYSVSAIKEDGAFMAVLSLAAAGQVRMVTTLPPFTNDFDVPQPKLSIWGLTEGDYRARRVDRWRLKWDVDVVPTATYKFGSPLHPSSVPLVMNEDGSPVAWPSLLEPPLPDDEDAPLPIWSSITGNTIIWPWWNRILNMVLQSMMFQPGAKAATILDICPKYTVEVFEIELILDWLVKINAARRTDHGTYDLLPCFWGVFGDRLIDEENDEYGEHVKRTSWKKKEKKQSWTSHYNLRNTTVQRTTNAEFVDSSSDDEDQMNTRALQTRRPLTQTQPPPTAPQDQELPRTMSATKTPSQSQQQPTEAQIDPVLMEVNNPIPSTQDLDMIDPDMDAEGELDDTMDMVMH